MIVKNEEKNLEKFLDSVKNYVDEIIIVDTGSIDKTKEIAKKFAKVYDFKWNNDFAAARNFSVSKAKGHWILVLDPDEIIDENDLIKLKKIILNKDKTILGYRLIQKTYYKNKIISIRGICRLFRNNPKIRFIYPIHETVRESIKALNERIGKTGIIIKHYPRLNKDKKNYYLKLLKIKKEKFPESNVDKEIELEKLGFSDLLC
jgi:glycosyltransferase involved in cell wall biosynthesis